MAKKKDASTGSADTSVLRRSGRETSSRKQTTSSPVNSRKSERIENHTSPSPSPVRNKLEKVEKQMGSSSLRRSDRGKKLVEIPDIPNIKSTKEKAANDSMQCSEDVNEDKKTEKQDPDVGGRKRKRFTAIRYKALFKPQRIRIESDDDEDPEVEDKSPQANTGRKEDMDKLDMDKELNSQNNIRVQEAPDKDYKVPLEGRVIDLDQIEDGDCPETKSLDEKSIESGDVDQHIGGEFSPSNRNIGYSDNHMFHTSSDRIEHDLEENRQDLDACHKATWTCKATGIMENAENNDISSNMQNSKFVEFWVPVQISNVQLEQYCATLLSKAMALSLKSDPLEALKEVFITNRKCCNHPYIVDPELQASLIKDKDQSMIQDIYIKASGKLHFLDHILPEIQKQQLRVLILFQPTSGTLRGSLSLGQILVDYVIQRFGENSYEHVDGVGNIFSKKQAAINIFNKDMSRFIFLLESRACHPNIKLSSVDVIIIFDSELNPSKDLKSLQKISINSQSEQIKIFRLYSSSTLEEKILKLAENNMAIDIRSQNLRSNYDALLTWGASDLFDKLTKLHSQTVLSISSDESLLKDVVEEFLHIISYKCKSNDATSKAVIIQVRNCGIYGKNIPLHSEIKTYLPDGEQPHIFWRKLLEGRSPIWKFVSESTPRQRKRPNYVLDSPPKGKSGVDCGAKTRRKTGNNSNVEPAQLKTVTEGETGGVNEGIPAANDESQSSSGDLFWSTTVNNEMSLLDLLKPTVSELCNIFKFSEDVKSIVEELLEFVIDNYQVPKGHTRLLQAFMISLCWIGSSLGKYKIDRSESFALAKKHFDFTCTIEDADMVCIKLQLVKETFLKSKQSLDCLKDSIPEPEGAKLEIIKSRHIPNDDGFENHKSPENVSRKGEEAFEKIKREWDKKRVCLEDDYKVDKTFIHALYNNPSIRSEKLKILEREFANKLEEHERLWEIHLEDLKATKLAAEGQVAADHEFSLHGSQHETQVMHCGNTEVAPTLPENPIEAQNHDDPVCEGAKDIESTGSQTSEKEMVDATVSSEQIGEVPAQQLGDDMEVDVAEKVDSSHENAKGGISNADASHAIEDHNETNANDMALQGESGDVEMPAGDYHKENNEDDTVVLDTSHVDKDRHETIDDVAPEVESAEMGTPAGTCNKENSEDGEIYPDKPDVGDDHNETSPNGDINPDKSDVGEANNEPSPDDVLPRVESAEMGTPAGTCDKEDIEEGEIKDDESDSDDDHNETSPNHVLPPHVESAGTATLADNEENAEDSIIRPDALHASEAHNDSCGSHSSNPVCAAISPDKIPSVQPDSSPASDHLEPIIPEIQNEPLQFEHLNVISNDEPDFPSSTEPMVAENPSDTLPPSGPLLEPIFEEPTLTVPQSGENMEENLVPDAEIPHEEQQPLLATSVAHAPPALNMFDNLVHQVSSQMPNQTDPLQAEVERLHTVKDNVAKFHQEMKQRLDSECEKEITEIVAQIRLKYEAKHQEADAAYNAKKMELETNINRVIMNKILADAFRSKCQELTPSGHPGTQQVSQAGLLQQLRRLSSSPSMRHFHGSPSSSPGQYLGSQQPPQPPPPQSQPPPLPLHQQLRPHQPLQIVNQPAALFSSMPSRPPSTTPNRPPSNTSPSTTPSRPPPVVVNQTPSTTPATSRSTVNPITPSGTPTTSRPSPVVNTINPANFPRRSPPSVTQVTMSAANLRISTETRGQSPHTRPLVRNEPRAPAPHMRPLVSNEPRAPAPHMRPLVSNEPRAPAPHLRSLASSETRRPAPHIRPFRSTPSVSPDVGTHRRMLPSQHITGGTSQSPVTPPSTSSPQSVTPVVPSQPPPSEPCTVPPPSQTPLLPSFDNLNGLIDSGPRWVNTTTPQHDLRSQTDRLDISDYIREGTGTAPQSSSVHDLVCLSDDD